MHGADAAVTGGLVVLHVDGLSHHELGDAIDRGDLPFVAELMEREDYVALPYHCGVPSTTPFAQAGILYGDNREIPGFRWWDRKAGLVVQFGARNTFAQVAHRYFHGTRPLCEEGACIAACYPAGARETFGLAYRDRSYGRHEDRSAGDVIRPWLSSPAHLADLIGHGVVSVAATAAAAARARLAGERPAATYVVDDMLEEAFLHHLTRYAVEQAMDAGYPCIYAGFYAYDETGHGFGPRDGYTRHMLMHVDHSIRAAAERRERNRAGRRYQLVVLSDHGQVETETFRSVAGCTLGEAVSRRLPGTLVEEHNGGSFGPRHAAQTRVVLAHSGGLSHLCFAAFPDRLPASEVRRRFPGLVEHVAALPGVGLVLMREGEHDVAVTARGEEPLEAALAPYGDVGRLVPQLHRLNGFDAAGDMVVIGRWDRARGVGVNFEEQAGGHGSIGGDQGEPFLLVRREWGVDTSAVTGAHELHPILRDLRTRFS